MNDQQNLISCFFECFSKRDFHDMRRFCTNDICYFDPLYNLLKGDDLFIMWQLEYALLDSFKLKVGEIKDEGDGYYIVELDLNYVSRKEISQKVKAFLRIENGKISEYSSAFSIHELCKQRNGIIGNLLGWNRLYQNRIKNDTKRKFIKFKQSGNAC